MYNITKVARGAVLQFFNEIFDGLTKLFNDVDADVKNGANLLDRLMKDVVTEAEHFDISKFIPLLGERIKIKNPFIRQLIVGWIVVLDSVPDIDMLQYLPEYLAGLFDMLSDPNKDIRQQSYSALSELLREITQTMQVNEPAGHTNGTAGGSSIDIPAMILILVHTCTESRDNFTKLIVLTWLHEFLIISSPKVLLPFVAEMLGVTLHCISDPEKEIRFRAEKTNELLLALVSGTDQPLPLLPLLAKLTSQLHNKWVQSRLASLRWLSMLLTKLNGLTETFLQADLFPVLLKTLQDQDDLVVKLDIEVLARMCLNAQSQIEEKNFALVLHYLLNLFKADRKFLEIRGSFIIRSLCELLDAEEIYRKLSSILAGPTSNGATNAPASAIAAADPQPEQSVVVIANSPDNNDDWEFNALMVQTLNLILLTSVELTPLRNRLKNCLQSTGQGGKVDEAGLSLFQSLYASWVHNPISTFSLCLLTQTYFLASELIIRIAQIDITVNYLMQIDKLIQLLESPIFLHLRLKLLEEPSPQNHILYLLKSLYGVLMLLPQSTAFTSLKTRLESVSPLVLLMKGVHEMRGAASSSSSSGVVSAVPPTSPALESAVSASRKQVSLEGSLPIADLLKHFEEVQAKHAAKKQRTIKSASLIKRDTNQTTQ